VLNLQTPIENLSNVGAVTAKRLKRLGLKTVKDLIFYFPFRYDNFSKTTDINDLKPGDKVNIKGTIELIENRRSPRKRMNITEALVANDDWQIKVIWFNQPFIAKTLKAGDMVSLSGKIDSEYGNFLLKSPEYQKIHSTEKTTTEGGELINPLYHLTLNITQKQIRFLIGKTKSLIKKLPDFIPTNIIQNQKLLSQAAAIEEIHFPKNLQSVEKARKRLAFNELFLLQLQSQLIKEEFKNNLSEKIIFQEKDTKKFVQTLPFTLTDAQKKSSWSILQDMEKLKPMSRLLQGDVGSGKTVVAIIALLNTALNKKQAVLMVPTEILAKQHFENISKILGYTKIKIGLITRVDKKLNFKFKAKKKKISSKEIVDEADIIIGTHSLIQNKINFKNLGLAIIDEQHRFGVEQRKKLLKKHKRSPHLLSMTATPIPRSLALALYGDLDISVIDEMPKGRKTIITKLVEEYNRNKAYDFVKKEVRAGKQVFVICPLIDISDKLGVKSVKEEFKKLDKLIFPELKIAMLHGKLETKAKEDIMKKFVDKKTDILVSTSVIEVGVDVPNATIMMIEGADRFGLAQLHQFRGRVGRSEQQSYCFLFTDSDAPQTKERLLSLTKYNDGFELAKIDLKFRGPGEVFGTSQKGFPELKMASLFDYALMEKAQTEAKNFLKNKKNLDNNPELKHHINNTVSQAHLE